MELTALGYVGIRSAKLDEWQAYASGLLGMQSVEQTKAFGRYRMDDRKQRLVVEKSDGEGLAFMGWEAQDKATLERLAARLDARGIAVLLAPRTLCDERRVAEMIAFDDPGGHRLEVFVGAETTSDPFVPGRAISGFKTGPLGMGHVVMHVDDVDTLLPFYRDVLGFHVSDYGLTPYKLYFLHLNGRHHSFAMVGSGRAGLHHFMVELRELDDVGQGYDLAQLDEGRIAYTLGRHTNDHVTSFYSITPSGFFVEYGWNGRVIDPATWQPHETFDGPSLWGHERLNLPREQREKLRQMRLDAAAKGIRAPVVVPDCPWLDSVIGHE